MNRIGNAILTAVFMGTARSGFVPSCMDGPLSARGFSNALASGSGAVMYPAYVRGHGPLALREYVDRVPIIATRSRRDDEEECPDLGARPFCRHVVEPLAKLAPVAAARF